MATYLDDKSADAQASCSNTTFLSLRISSQHSSEPSKNTAASCSSLATNQLEAAIWRGLHFIDQNQSFTSNADIGFLLKSMFLDSHIVQCYKMSETNREVSSRYYNSVFVGYGTAVDLEEVLHSQV